MLTRGQVARRLGKSLATVRRLEGVELHPWQDERGVHRFDEAEVERVARGERGAWRRPTRDEPSRGARNGAIDLRTAQDALTVPAFNVVERQELELRLSSLEDRISARENDRDELRKGYEQRAHELKGENEKENERRLATLQDEVLDTLLSLTDRQLRRLSPDALVLIEELFE